MPGTKLRPTTQDDRVPLLVIQRTLRSASAEYESMHGFTLLLPRGWSMYLLQSIVYTGTLVGGLTERRTQHREAGVACFPEHIGAVCKAGEEYAKMKAIMEESRWARKPPAKRLEWRSLGTRNPFFPHWQDVMKVGHGKRHSGII